MSTLEGRGGTALLVIDMQVDVVAQAVDRDGVIAHTSLYWRYQSAPGKEASVRDAAEVAFG
ncbi:hypothetical protein [Demequina subtropica]|uniref:hypothetical protein n=1 Tax=Demequina subtropica TaxID=1638989 RepID=UPI000784F280|nr:hypothetical protein [Demequina subtropica]